MEDSDLKQTNEQHGGGEKSCHPRQVLFPNLTLVQLGWNHTQNTLQPATGWSHLPTSLRVHNALSSEKILQITNVFHQSSSNFCFPPTKFILVVIIYEYHLLPCMAIYDSVNHICFVIYGKSLPVDNFCYKCSAFSCHHFLIAAIWLNHALLRVVMMIWLCDNYLLESPSINVSWFHNFVGSIVLFFLVVFISHTCLFLSFYSCFCLAHVFLSSCCGFLSFTVLVVVVFISYLLQAPRLQREPEQPYCGICQA